MTAYLTYDKPYACFNMEQRNIFFAMPPSLERIVKVTQWDKAGRIVFNGKYDYQNELIEDYIDMDYVFETLDLNPHELNKIKTVQLL